MAVDTVTSTGTDAPTHKRATVRPDKADAVAAIAQAFTGSTAAVLTEYRGLTVKQISDLRVALGKDTSYQVVKNTLTRIAAADAGITGVDALLSGPTAVAFIGGEPVEAAKALREFARANPVLIVKGGIMDGKTLTPQEVGKLADLESREVLLAKMAGGLLASLSNAVYLLNAPLAQAARLVGALRAKAEADPSVLAGGTGAADSMEPAPVADEQPDPVVAGTAAGAATEPAADTAASGPGDPDIGATTDGDTGAPAATVAEGVTPAETDA